MNLIGQIQTSDYAAFYNSAYSVVLNPGVKKATISDDPPKGECCKCQNNRTEPKPEDNGYRLACILGGYLRSLWSYLAASIAESSTKSASVELPVPPDIVIPQQTALMRDDGKERVDIMLRDVSGITPGEITAKLVLSFSTGTSYEFPAETILPDPLTKTLALQFPSPAKWNLGKIISEKSKLHVESRKCDIPRICSADKIESHDLAVLLIEAPSEKPKPGFDLRASTKEIVVDKGAGTVKLVFDNFKDDSAVLTWSGAEVKSAKDAGGAAVAIALDKITVKAPTVLTLEIQNAKPDGKVTFTAVGSKREKKTGEETKEFSVVAGK